MIAVFGMCVVILSSIVVPIDDPETRYDESEAPVAFATPAAVDMSARSRVIELIADPVAILKGLGKDCDNGAMKSASTVQREGCTSRSQFKLLSTLRC